MLSSHPDQQLAGTFTVLLRPRLAINKLFLLNLATPFLSVSDTYTFLKVCSEWASSQMLLEYFIVLESGNMYCARVGSAQKNYI